MQISEIDLKLKLISYHLLMYALPRFRVLTVYILYSYPCTLICSLFISLLDQFASNVHVHFVNEHESSLS